MLLPDDGLADPPVKAVFFSLWHSDDRPYPVAPSYVGAHLIVDEGRRDEALRLRVRHDQYIHGKASSFTASSAVRISV